VGWERRKQGGQLGFTIIELMIVVALIGIVAAMSIPLTARYRVASDTRRHANSVMGALQHARELATSTGRPAWVVFDDPNSPVELPDGVFARIVLDAQTGGTAWAPDDGIDTYIDHALEPGLSPAVTAYGQGPNTPFIGSNVPPEDTSAATLLDLTDASSFDPDPTTGLPGVGFTSQGIAVTAHGSDPKTRPRR
jgi:prepilin-type N-terminal cleavage/methylation domain-containing protein